MKTKETKMDLQLVVWNMKFSLISSSQLPHMFLEALKPPTRGISGRRHGEAVGPGNCLPWRAGTEE